MAEALDFVARLDASGRLSGTARKRIKANLRARARDLDADDAVDVRVRITAPVRSGAQNRLYWSVMGRVALAFTEAGKAYTSDALHLYCKSTLLPRVAAEAERETGEAVEYESVVTLPDGRAVRTLTTTRLSTAAFTAYVHLIDFHFNAELGLAVDLSDLLDEAGSVRSGKVQEPDDLRLVPFDDAPLSDEPFAEPAGEAAKEGPGPIERAPNMADLYADNPLWG